MATLLQGCPTCMESKIVDSDYVYIYLDEPTQIVRSLVWDIMRIVKTKEISWNGIAQLDDL